MGNLRWLSGVTLGELVGVEYEVVLEVGAPQQGECVSYATGLGAVEDKARCPSQPASFA